jgi:hypothetical protein
VVTEQASNEPSGYKPNASMIFCSFAKSNCGALSSSTNIVTNPEEDIIKNIFVAHWMGLRKDVGSGG